MTGSFPLKTFLPNGDVDMILSDNGKTLDEIKGMMKDEIQDNSGDLVDELCENKTETNDNDSLTTPTKSVKKNAVAGTPSKNSKDSEILDTLKDILNDIVKKENK